MNNKFIELCRSESMPGILLLIAGTFAMLVSNSPFSVYYEKLFHVDISIYVGGSGIAKPILLWVNDGLMAIFFLMVGLEIKKEFLEGNLSSLTRVALPAIAAVGGIVLPAIIFVLLNLDENAALRGWAIPTATDIAFALGILTLLGSKAPRELKLLLLTIAIFDDLFAICIIALFYSVGLSFVALWFAICFMLLLYIMNRLHIKSISPYIAIGICLWVCVLKSGVHATLTGVALAFAIPLHVPHDRRSPLKWLEKSLNSWVVFFILPMFAFANTGISLKGMTMTQLLDSVPLGIAIGLFVGKQLGIFSFAWVGLKLRIATKPPQVNWLHLYGMAILCGIGFTMSLFIGSLAYPPKVSEYALINRIGILSGSAASAIIGYIFLRIVFFFYPHKNEIITC